MLIHKTFRYRIYPTIAQEQRLVKWEASLRFLWNLAHEQRLMGLSRQKAERKYYTAFDQINELKELRAELLWFADVPYNVCSQLLVELDKAWQRCFKKLGRVPHWKLKGRDFLSIIEPSYKKWRFNGLSIKFPKLGNLHAILHRQIEGKPKTCTLKCDGDQWFACISCEIEIADTVPRVEPIVAIDRGITNLLADSNGNFTANPRFYTRSIERLARAQRTVSRRKKGSKNREKAKHRVMCLHRKVSRQRAHVLHVESARYTKNHGIVVIEKLNIAGMIKSRLARSIADAGWGIFADMLRYKLAWSGGQLIEVPAAYSSQTCSVCDEVDSSSRKGERFCCTKCGHLDHADLNAAKVLKQRFITPRNPWWLPVEGSVLKASQRSRKSKVSLRVPRIKPSKNSDLVVGCLITSKQVV